MGGQVADSLGQALLLLEDMQHYASYWDMDVAIKLKWHTIAVRTPFPFSLFFFFFFSSVSPLLIFNLLLLFVVVPSYPIGSCPRTLKVVMEEAGKEKALKQVAESSLSEKVIELATVEQRAASTERAQGSAE